MPLALLSYRLNEYRRSRYGELENMAKTALEHPAVGLTEKQATICRYLVNSVRPSQIARKLQQSRQAVHSQIKTSSRWYSQELLIANEVTAEGCYEL
jgi:predicted DNA-binding protein YlxM (UPF0122 family)